MPGEDDCSDFVREIVLPQLDHGLTTNGNCEFNVSIFLMKVVERDPPKLCL